MFINEFNGDDVVLYPDRWPNYENKFFGDVLKNKEFNPYSEIRLKYIIEFWKKNRINYKRFIPIWEWMIYLPYLEHHISKIIHDIEYIKPLFECGTILGDCLYIDENGLNGTAIGCAEGLALSYVLDKYDIEFKRFKSEHLSLW